MADAADWFHFRLGKAGSGTDAVAIAFQDAQGDLDLELYNASGVRVGLSDGTANSERLSLSNRPGW